MNQHEAVIKVMEENGGYATFKYLYEKSLKVKGSTWKTKTPYASIRRIVQDERFFFKIRPGLWALKAERKNVLKRLEISDTRDKKQQEKFSHSYYQGLLIEIGNLRGLKTFVPAQDKNRNYLGKKLIEITSLDKIYSFTYDSLLRFVKTIDVVWFNDRKLPKAFFEVEYSTNFTNNLSKFVELQDFNVEMNMVADSSRKRAFDDKKSMAAFRDISKRVQFKDFEWVVKSYENEVMHKQLQGR